ncbi:eukaryotic translation initiation factor 4B [Orussus abietinus]|uniref:eukaryotic translation initiation factor 4B n=1 Tax=Orussus abietinus TaxID=222816 RepID=UPI0006255B40|nr:eukaryotic translation initiation factor 4B [Orussus abietinus]
MSSGKKGKKNKVKEQKTKLKTLPLTDFLADTPGAHVNAPMKSSSWADDVEDDDYDDMYSSRRNKKPVVLPTAPRVARGPGIDEENIPTNPPYVAYISNLPYEVDEEVLAEFFADMKIVNMRLPKDSSKLRGYGYVEFEDRQTLIEALSMTNRTIKTRRVRIEVSNSSNDDRRSGSRMGRDSYRDDPERTSGDWRSGPREDSSDRDRFRSYGGFDNRRGEDREADDKPGGWREGDRGGSAFRDRPSFRDDDRDKEWSRFGDRGNRDRGGFREDDRDRGSSFGPRRTYGDSDWEKDRRPASEDAERDELRTRPKLQLQPRSKPIEPITAKEDSSSNETSAPAPSSAPTPVPAVNIFGAAKPVDTAAREREIEERLTRSYADTRSREEGDDKRGAREGTWGRRNEDGRDDRERRPRPTWRSDEDRERPMERPAQSHSTSARSDSLTKLDQRSESRESSGSRAAPSTRGTDKPDDSEESNESTVHKERDREDDSDKIPVASEQAPNFVASNKYSVLPSDEEPDNADD